MSWHRVPKSWDKVKTGPHLDQYVNDAKISGKRCEYIKKSWATSIRQEYERFKYMLHENPEPQNSQQSYFQNLFQNNALSDVHGTYTSCDTWASRKIEVNVVHKVWKDSVNPYSEFPILQIDKAL